MGGYKSASATSVRWHCGSAWSTDRERVSDTMVHGIRIPWYRIERGGAPREVAPELSLGRLQCPPATARRAERAANERHAARRWRRRPS